jgi:sulfonate transport system ATP-binding protein
VNQNLITISNLFLALDRIELLREFSLTLPQKTRIGITGPSGCGKSTLLRSLIHKAPPSRSRFEEFRVNLHDEQRIGYVPQAGGLLPWYSLHRNLSIFVPHFSDIEESDEGLREVLQAMGLLERSGYFPDQLSSGEAQRALLACGIVTKPTMFLADEPLTEVDLRRKWQILEYWSTRIAELGSALLLVSHDVDVLLYLCDEIIVLDGTPAYVTQRFNLTALHPRDEGALFADDANEVRRALTRMALLPVPVIGAAGG